MKLYIKSMFTFRSKLVIKEELHKVGLKAFKVDFGEVEIFEPLSPDQHQQLKAVLMATGYELIDDSKAILIDKIMNVIIHTIHFSEERPIGNFSDYLSQELEYNYTYLSNLFAEVTGSTIERCLIAHKIEKVKELILYDELSLTEIAATLRYSSVSHLSSQFKKVTGLTPTFFKTLKFKKRTPIEEVCNSDC